MNNKINWFNYVDHIFCFNYLPNNRYNSFVNKLKNVNINVDELPNSKLTFIYDYNANIFNEEINDLQNKIQNFINVDFDYLYNYSISTFKLSLNIYKMLKIAEYFNYDKILYIEDDVVFMNDNNYLINALNRLNNLNFDILLGQGAYNFNNGDIFNDSYYKKYIIYEDEYFIKFKDDITSYGASLVILTKNGINKLLKLYEYLHYTITLDMIFGILNNDLKFDIITVKKPLAIQDYYFDIEINNLKKINSFLNINDYKL